jgi:hypothetical protein
MKKWLVRSFIIIIIIGIGFGIESIYIENQVEKIYENSALDSYRKESESQGIIVTDKQIYAEVNGMSLNEYHRYEYIIILITITFVIILFLVYDKNYKSRK